MTRWLTAAFLILAPLQGDSFYSAREWTGSITSRSLEHPSHATFHYEGQVSNDLVSYRIGYSACVEAVHQQPDLAAVSDALDLEEPDPEIDLDEFEDETASEQKRKGYRSSRQVAFPDPSKGTDFAPLGLLDLPFWGWRSSGFINVKVNRYDIVLARPRFKVLRARGKDAALQVTWPIQDADVVQTFVLRDGDDKLLLEIKIVPYTEEIEELTISFGYQMAGASQLWTPRGEGAASDATRRYPGTWTVLPGSKGKGPGALLWRNVDGMRATITGAARFDFKYPPSQREAHFAIWAFPKALDESAAQYLKTHAAAFGKQISAFASAGWKAGGTPVILPRRPTGSEFLFSENDARDGFALYAVPLFDRVLIDTVPSKEQVIKSMGASAARGTAVPMSFVLFSERALNDLEVSVTGPLTGAKGQIARDALDLRMVKVWRQRVAGILHEGDLTRRPTPELLVTDDRMDSLPRMPRRDVLTTSMPAGTSRQFWLTARINEDVPAGDYRGEILIKTSEGRERRLPIRIQVQPFVLRRPQNRIFALDLPLRPAGKKKVGPRRVPAALYKKYLEDIREHGINVVGFPAAGDSAEETLELQRAAGLLAGPLLVLNPPGPDENASPEQSEEHWKALAGRWKKRAAEAGALGPLFGFTNWGGPSKQACRLLAQLGHRTLAFLNWKEAESHDGLVQVPVIEHSRRGRGVFLEARDLCREQKGSPLYTWPAWAENPKLNRLLAGFYLWSARFDGFVARTYQDVEGDAFDFTDGKARDRCLAWPSEDGPIPTLQWEALREGIMDYCYVHTLALQMDAAEKAGGAKAGVAQQIRIKLSSLLEKYSHEATYLWGTHSPQSYNFPFAFRSVSNATFAADRKQIESWILELGKD
ncbi:MAG: hypothetical protein QF473_19185 [Planctomycetota bacterium]|nr:hypothetical protein [Planctomycetota bacterium]